MVSHCGSLQNSIDYHNYEIIIYLYIYVDANYQDCMYIHSCYNFLRKLFFPYNYLFFTFTNYF